MKKTNGRQIEIEKEDNNMWGEREREIMRIKLTHGKVGTKKMHGKWKWRKERIVDYKWEKKQSLKKARKKKKTQINKKTSRNGENCNIAVKKWKR